LLAEDNRIGLSHMQVPGPDGYYGFGGGCFPKDTNALVKYAAKLGVQLSVLKSAIKKNVLLRLQKPK
jgi:UDPglucose 6-dehydrogenase